MPDDEEEREAGYCDRHYSPNDDAPAHGGAGEGGGGLASIASGRHSHCFIGCAASSTITTPISDCLSVHSAVVVCLN